MLNMMINGFEDLKPFIIMFNMEWPKLNDTTLHLNGIEQRYF